MAKRILEYQIINHGCDGEQYFPGCGVAYTQYDHVATGIGNSAREAGEDALEQVHFSDALPGALDMEIEGMVELEKQIAELSGKPSFDANDKDISPEWHHYVSIRYRVTEE